MKTRIVKFVMLVMCLVTTSSCNNKYETQNISVVGWNYGPQNTPTFELREIAAVRKDHRTYRNNEDYYAEVSFIVKNEDEFIAPVKQNESFLYEEVDTKNKPIYVFAQNANIYYLRVSNDSSRHGKSNLFTLSNAVSFYDVNDNSRYLFPLIDFQIYFYGQFFFNTEREDNETTHDWDSLVAFYNLIGEEFCKVDDATKTIKLKACLMENDSNKGISEESVIMLTFEVTAANNIINATLL